ncbi:MAG: hypothetical protein ACTSXP_16150, partial [Promethearchaeota archaeon]
STILLIAALGTIIPVAISALIGTLLTRKAGKVKSIFFGPFLGLLVGMLIGVIIQIVKWETGTTIILGIEYWQWFLPSAIVLGALNAAFWSGLGLLLTRKKWD